MADFVNGFVGPIAAAVVATVLTFLFNRYKLPAKARIRLVVRSYSMLEAIATNTHKSEHLRMVDVRIMFNDEYGISPSKSGASVPYIIRPMESVKWLFAVPQMADLLRALYRPSRFDDDKDFAYIPIYVRCIDNTGRVFRSRGFQFSNNAHLFIGDDERLRVSTNNDRPITRGLKLVIVLSAIFYVILDVLRVLLT